MKGQSLSFFVQILSPKNAETTIPNLFVFRLKKWKIESTRTHCEECVVGGQYVSLAPGIFLPHQIYIHESHFSKQFCEI